MQDLFIYLIVFAWYFSVTCETRSWAHITGMIIADFLNQRGGRRGGRGQLPLTTLFSVLPPYLPSFSQHMDAGVPRDVFQMPEHGENIDRKNPTVLPTVALSQSHTHTHTQTHTLTWSPLLLTVLFKKPILGPEDFQDTTWEEQQNSRRATKDGSVAEL